MSKKQKLWLSTCLILVGIITLATVIIIQKKEPAVSEQAEQSVEIKQEQQPTIYKSKSNEVTVTVE